MFYKPRFAPSLIDLIAYEKDLLYEREHGIPLRPCPTIPGLIWGQWSDSEMQAMRDNREQARLIYERIRATIKP